MDLYALNLCTKHVLAMQDGILLVCWLRDVKTEIDIYSLEAGEFCCPLPLPGIGSVQVLHGRAQDSEIFLSFTSCTLPGQIYRQAYHTASILLSESLAGSKALVGRHVCPA